MLKSVNMANVPIDFSSSCSNRFYTSQDGIHQKRPHSQYGALFTLQLGCLVSMTCKQRGLDKGLDFCGGFKGGTKGLVKGGGGNRGCI